MTQALNLANFANNLNTSGQTSNGGLQNSTIGITAGTGLSGGGTPALGASTSLAIANTGVAAGTYGVSGSTYPIVTLNAQGQVTSASIGTIPTATQELVLIGSANASGSASIDFTSISNTTYSAYRLICNAVVPSYGSANFLLRGQVGSTWIASDYTWQSTSVDANGATGCAAQNGIGAGIDLVSNALGLFGSPGGSFDIMIYQTSGSAYHAVNYQGYYYSQPGISYTVNGGGWLTGGPAINGFRLFMDVGVISSGTFYLYGYKNT